MMADVNDDLVIQIQIIIMKLLQKKNYTLIKLIEKHMKK
jgi:hypothetical protein